MRSLPLVAALLLTAFAGCMADGPDPTPAGPAAPARATTPGAGLDASRLSKDEFGVGPRNEGYVPAADGILLHVEWYLPDGKPGPWPTILENSPYNGQNECQLASALCRVPSLADRYVPKG